MSKLSLTTNAYLLVMFYLPGTAMIAYAPNLDICLGGFIWCIGGIVIHKLYLNDPLIWHLVNKYI